MISLKRELCNYPLPKKPLTFNLEGKISYDDLIVRDTVSASAIADDYSQQILIGLAIGLGICFLIYVIFKLKSRRKVS